MKRVSSLLLLVSVCLLCLMSGCGSKDVTGTLTMSQPTVDSSNATFSRVTVTISYTNPNVTSVGNVVVTVNGEEFVLNDNGTNTSSFNLTYLRERDPVADGIFTITATTGDLEASVAAVIPKRTAAAGTLIATPPSITFTAAQGNGTSQDVAISGGSGTYLQPLVSPNPNPNISAQIVGSTLTITRTSNAVGSALVVVLDDAASPATIIIPVTLQ